MHDTKVWAYYISKRGAVKVKVSLPLTFKKRLTLAYTGWARPFVAFYMSLRFFPQLEIHFVKLHSIVLSHGYSGYFVNLRHVLDVTTYVVCNNISSVVEF